MTEILNSCEINKEIDNNNYWLAEDVTPYIMKFLIKKFPECIIIREFDKIDIIVLNINLPVEIQSTIFDKKRNSIFISRIEDLIRRQIEINIKIYGRCWLFLDENFIKYLNNDTSKKKYFFKY